MDFQFSPQQELLRKSVRNLPKGHLAQSPAHGGDRRGSWIFTKRWRNRCTWGSSFPGISGDRLREPGRMIMLEEVGRVRRPCHGVADLSSGNRAHRGFRERGAEKEIPGGLGQGRAPIHHCRNEARRIRSYGDSDHGKLQETATSSTAGNASSPMGTWPMSSPSWPRRERAPKASALHRRESFRGSNSAGRRRSSALHGCNTGEISMENCVSRGEPARQ